MTTPKAPHPLTTLVLARAASNPEEMVHGKWQWVLDCIQKHGSQADKDAVLPVYNKVMLDGAHKRMMQQLLDPEPEQIDLFAKQRNSAYNPSKKPGQP